MTTPPTTPCCAEYAGLSRRGLLRGALVAGAATTFGSAVLSTSPASAAPARAVLLMLSLRGASDGLSLVVPHGDPVYYQARPRIAVPADTLVAKDAFFGLHPAMAPLLPLWSVGQGRGRPRVRAPGPEPLALLGDGAARGRQPRAPPSARAGSTG